MLAPESTTPPRTQKVLSHFHHNPLMAVIRFDTYNDALWASEQAIKAGYKTLDVTYGTPKAVELIQHLTRHYPDIVVGAGTVLNFVDADRAVNAGARFLASPCFDVTLVEYGREQDVAILPGVTTATEMMNALKAGAPLLKFFPAEAVGGTTYLKSVMAPLPHLPIVVTGGINQKNVLSYLQAGAIAAGLGGSVFPAEWVAQRNSDQLVSSLKQTLDTVMVWHQEKLAKMPVTSGGFIRG